MSDITSLAELRALYGVPKPASLKKQTSALNSVYKQWLQHARFFVIASVGADGVDCAPRGDAQNNAFAIINDNLIAIPDRRGNNRLDTLSNILTDGRVALLFFVPGIAQTIRIVGTASVSTDPTLLDLFIENNEPPVSCIRVSIDAVFFQNARALTRSALWQAKSQLEAQQLPSPGQMIASIDPEFDADAYDARQTSGNNADGDKGHTT